MEKVNDAMRKFVDPKRVIIFKIRRTNSKVSNYTTPPSLIYMFYVL